MLYMVLMILNQIDIMIEEDKETIDGLMMTDTSILKKMEKSKTEKAEKQNFRLIYSPLRFSWWFQNPEYYPK